MIEKVARAIWPEPFEGDGPGWNQRRAVAMDQARSAIEAMQEPGEEMIKAASFILTAQSGVYGPDDIWEIMIKAALKE